jgi:hypothetical protein
MASVRAFISFSVSTIARSPMPNARKMKATSETFQYSSKVLWIIGMRHKKSLTSG